jgi:hypothetical protein
MKGKILYIILGIAVLGSLIYSGVGRNIDFSIDKDTQVSTTIVRDAPITDNVNETEGEPSAMLLEPQETTPIDYESNKYNSTDTTSSTVDSDASEAESTVEDTTSFKLDDSIAKSILYGDFDTLISDGYIDSSIANQFKMSDYVASVQEVVINSGGVSEDGNSYMFDYSLTCTGGMYDMEFGLLKVKIEDSKIVYLHKFVIHTV